MFCPSTEARKKFREKHSINENEFVVVYTGKLTEAKGGKLLAETFKDKFDAPITLVCVGSPPDNEYGREVHQLLNASENKVIMFPTQKYMELAPFYQMADLSVFPKQCSMSFYDAQACGLPVLSEANNVNCDRCNHDNGDNFEAGNVSDFKNKIMKFAVLENEQMKKYRENARAFIEGGYDYATIAKEYTSYLEKSIEIPITYTNNFIAIL